MSKTTPLHVQHTFLKIISLPFLHNCHMKIPNFSFYGESKWAMTKFYFSFWTWISEGSPTFYKVSG